MNGAGVTGEITAARKLRSAIRKAKREAAAWVLLDVAKKFGIDIMSMRVPPFDGNTKLARAEFMQRADRLIGRKAIADLLHCDESTVRYYVSDRYRILKRMNENARYHARSRAAAREGIRPD